MKKQILEAAEPFPPLGLEREREGIREVIIIRRKEKSEGNMTATPRAGN